MFFTLQREMRDKKSFSIMYPIFCGLIELTIPTNGFTFSHIMIFNPVSLTGDRNLHLNIYIFSHNLTYDGITLMALQKCPTEELPCSTINITRNVHEIYLILFFL
jgi:hypothetical protein